MPIRHTVVAGDSVISLSDEHGLFPDTIWNDGGNADLKQKRQDMNVLLPGDVVVIPDLRPRLEKRPTGAKHRFRRKGLPAVFRLQVFDQNIARSNEPYKLTVDGGAPQTGTTDGQGIIQCFIPAQSKEGELVVGKGDDELLFAVEFGYLDPLNEVTGVQHRLTNLGYDCGEPDGTWNAQTKQALRDFQRNHSIQVTGEFDAATKAKMHTVHDEPYKYPDPEESGSQ